MKKLYVGKLPYSVNDTELSNLFAQYGTVASATVMMDRETGRSRGFGFVEMADDAEADTAIEKLNGSEMNGLILIVNEARPLTERPPRRDFGGRPPMRGGSRRFGDDRRSSSFRNEY